MINKYLVIVTASVMISIGSYFYGVSVGKKHIIAKTTSETNTVLNEANRKNLEQVNEKNDRNRIIQNNLSNSLNELNKSNSTCLDTPINPDLARMLNEANETDYSEPSIIK